MSDILEYICTSCGGTDILPRVYKALKEDGVSTVRIFAKYCGDCGSDMTETRVVRLFTAGVDNFGKDPRIIRTNQTPVSAPTLCITQGDPMEVPGAGRSSRGGGGSSSSGAYQPPAPPPAQRVAPWSATGTATTTSTAAQRSSGGPRAPPPQAPALSAKARSVAGAYFGSETAYVPGGSSEEQVCINVNLELDGTFSAFMTREVVGAPGGAADSRTAEGTWALSGRDECDVLFSPIDGSPSKCQLEAIDQDRDKYVIFSFAHGFEGRGLISVSKLG